uniref:DDB1- and CUL4-associated factor 1 n=2 Tax=Tetranychus urticae TaxID=32264 RepID=T1KIJ0_TETUR
MNRLVNDYLMHRDDVELQTHSCRLMLDILPGLETSVVFKETEGLVNKLYEMVRVAKEPLKSYATGLLAAAMDVQDIAIENKDQNMQLVPIMLQRLNELKDSKREPTINENDETGSSDSLNMNSSPKSDSNSISNSNGIAGSNSGSEIKSIKRSHEGTSKSPSLKRRRVSSPLIILSPSTVNSECSNSSWADIEPYMIGSFQMYPLTPEMQQRFIFQYLTPIGDYQEILVHVFANDALSIIKHYINLEKNHDVRVAFEALKYLASLLCHKKFAIEFLNGGGLELLLQVYRPSVAATGVSICLYYLGYNEDAMEKICVLPRHILSDLVSYALWLLECSHDSSRCHATMFFGLTFAFRIILDLFDAKDGLRKLLNVIFLLDIFADERSATDDELFTKRQTARQVCIALKRYFEAHLVIEAENIRRSPLPGSSSSQHSVKSHSGNIPSYKAAHYTADTIHEYVESLLELMPLRINWKPVDELLKLGGLKLLISLISNSSDWLYTGKSETIKSALDVLVVCSVTPKFQLALTENTTISEDRNVPIISVILAAASESELPGTSVDPEVKKSALHVIINCVCGPLNRIGDTIARLCSGTKKRSFRNGEDVLTKMWNVVRSNNGIMILLNLLTIKTPITDADSIRALACKALCGLARSDTVKQIISKLPLFTSGQFQSLMKEPILQDKRTEHVKFCKYCIQLIESVTGAPISANIDTSPANIAKAEVVAQTKITYNERELLQLIHQHLLNKGLTHTASQLLREASLPVPAIPTPTRAHPPIWTTSPLSSKNSRPVTTPASSTPSIHPPTSLPMSSNNPNINNISLPIIHSSPSSSIDIHQTNHLPNTPATPSSPMTTSLVPSSTSSIPMKIYRSTNVKNLSTPRNLIRQKPQQGVYQPSPVMKRLNESNLNPVPSITLDSIVTEYLRKQHALCKNPVVTCPPFDLFVPHRCPEPLNRHTAPLNITLRVQRREIAPRFGGMYGTKFDRKFIYSRFRPVRTYRDPDGTSFTSCAFSYVEQYLFLGTATGELAVFNLHPGVFETSYTCHDSDITFIEPSRDGKLVLTGTIWRSPLSALWKFTDVFDRKLEFPEDTYCEFSKQVQDKVLGTTLWSANMYDINTGQKIKTFVDENLSNKYNKNRATFNPTDELILNDGVLWDVRSGSTVHKFDKFNQSINGVFHPNGWEIISNSEVWDLRTYHLIKTVPALDQCRVRFNKTGDVIYGAMFEEESSEDDDNTRSPFGSSFRTFDATDYSNIATIDVKKSICDLAVDPGDNFVAVVEYQKEQMMMSTAESACRLFEVGRCKEEDDEEAEEEEEEEGDDIEDDSDDGDLEHDNTDDIAPDGESDLELLGMELNDADDDDDDDDDDDEDDEEDEDED